MLELLGMLAALLELCLTTWQRVRGAVVQPLATIVLLIAVYVGRCILQEGSVRDGLHVAFNDGESIAAARQHGNEAAMLQAALRRFADSDRLIQQLLQALLQQVPSAARVRVAAIAQGVVGGAINTRLQFDIINAVAAPGRSPGPMFHNQPLSDWGDILSDLLIGRCQLVMVSQMRGSGARERVMGMGASTLLACPVIDVRQTLLGGIFLMWDANDPPPIGDSLRAATQVTQDIAAQIASILDLRLPDAFPLEARR